MPLIEYVLLAMIGSGGLGTPTTVGPEAIVQPNGGAISSAQEPPKKEDSRRGTKTQYHRRHRRHRHGKIHSYMPKKDGGKKS